MRDFTFCPNGRFRAKNQSANARPTMNPSQGRQLPLPIRHHASATKSPQNVLIDGAGRANRLALFSQIRRSKVILPAPDGCIAAPIIQPRSGPKPGPKTGADTPASAKHCQVLNDLIHRNSNVIKVYVFYFINIKIDTLRHNALNKNIYCDLLSNVTAIGCTVSLIGNASPYKARRYQVMKKENRIGRRKQ